MLYRLPLAGTPAHLLIVGDRGAELLAGWPGEAAAWPLDTLADRLQRADAPAFDALAMPGLLCSGGRTIVEGFSGVSLLSALSGRLVPGGVVVGDAPRSWAARHRLASSGVGRLRSTLEGAGLTDVECYFVSPSIDDPMTLIPAERRASNAHFRRQLARARPHFTPLGYALRAMAIALSLGARDQCSILFWARRPC